MKDNNDELMDLVQDDVLSIDFKKYWTIIRDNWKTIAKWTGVAFVIGCLVALSTPHKYQVTTKLAPELSSTATNRLSSMAAMMGFSSNMLGTTDAVYPMVYPDLVHSPEFIADLFDERVQFTYRKERMDTTLYAFLTEFGPKNPVAAVLGFPGRVIGWVKDLFASEEEGEGETMVDSFCFTRDQSMVYKALQKSIEAEIDKKTLVLTISVTMSDRYVAAQLSRAVNANIKKYVTKYRTEKAAEDRDYYKVLYDEAQRDYYNSQEEYSSYVDSHQGMATHKEQIEGERLRSESTLKFQLYTSIAQQLQGAEAKVQQETPVFAEIVTPTVPRRSVDSRKKKALGFAFLGLCAGAVWVIWKNRKDV